MRRPARPERICRRCPFRAPSGGCLERVIKSGRCGDWIWWVLHGKQIRRPYLYPHDPRSPAQVRSRARFGAASTKYSSSLTDKQRNACVTAGAKRRSRTRLGQSGPLTGQQYSIRKEYVLQKAHGKAIKGPFAPQVPQPQKLNSTSSDPRRASSRVAPDRHRLRTRRASQVRPRKQKLAEARMKKQEGEWSSERRQAQRLARLAGKRGRSTPLPRRFVATARPPEKARRFAV